MQSARSLDAMDRLGAEVAAADRARFEEIVAILAAAPRPIPSAWLPLWGRTMCLVRRDLREILGRCCRDRRGETLAAELLRRLPEEGDPLD